MVDLDKPRTTTTTTNKKDLHSIAMKRTSEWILSQEVPSDIIIHAGGTSFPLHKFPLVSKCGLVKKLITESTNADLSEIDLGDIPGGAEAFELAAKFCYGINFEISTTNIAMLRCVAEYLKMTEDYALENLVARTDAYLNEVVLKTLPGAVTVLHSSQNFLPLSEKFKLVNRCIDAIACIACTDTQTCLSGVSWPEDLALLRIDIFHRVLIAMMARGFEQKDLAPLLVLYAQKSLQDLEYFGRGGKKIEPKDDYEKRVVLEIIVSLLPKEKNIMAVSFLSMLLRAATYLETTFACRLDLERRISLQIEQAVLDDLLIPSYSFSGETLFDVESVERMMKSYVKYATDDDEMERVEKLMESYLAEIASDWNLSVVNFITLTQLLPEKARILEDGIYRAIDIYLKAHPALSDSERRTLCGVMNCRNLSREACTHAAKNDRLPIHIVVQVLNHEQQYLRELMNSNESLPLPDKTNNIYQVSDELSTLKRENQDLKLELVKMNVKLKGIEKNGLDISETSSRSGNKTRLLRKSLFSSVSKTLGKISTFLHVDAGTGGTPPNTKSRNKASKNRRHSIS